MKTAGDISFSLINSIQIDGSDAREGILNDFKGRFRLNLLGKPLKGFGAVTVGTSETPDLPASLETGGHFPAGAIRFVRRRQLTEAVNPVGGVGPSAVVVFPTKVVMLCAGSE